MSRRTPVMPGVGVGLALTLAGLSGCADGPGTEGPRLYVTSGFGDETLVLDPADGTILHRREMDVRPGERDEPHGVAVAPDGRHWYATLSHGEPTLWKFEAEGDRLVGRVALPIRGAARVEVSPDGRRAAVPDYWLGGLGASSQVAVVRLDDLAVEGAPEVCPAPHHALWDPAGERIAVTCALSDEVVILDAATLETVVRFPVLPDTLAPTPGNPVAKPMNLAWSPDGTRLYVSLMRAGRVAAFRDDGTPLWSRHSGEGPAQIAITPRGGWLVVANRGSGTLGLVDTDTGEARALPLGEALHPHGVALDPAGTTAFVTWEGTTTSPGGVTAVDLRDGTILWTRPAGLFTLGVAYAPSSGEASGEGSDEASGSSRSDAELMQ